MAITFHTADIKFSLRNRIALRGFIANQIAQSSTYKTVRLSFVFCSDEYLLNINRQFLNHDYYTDIITFPLSNSPDVLEAEIYISVDRVKENALKFEHKSSKSKANTRHSVPQSEFGNRQFLNELHRVIFHGVLHLLGYKDKTKAKQLEMRKMEDKWLNRFNS
jgi:ssRNA-specific RNase YbeY (16S rRNA maturation enzyme)